MNTIGRRAFIMGSGAALALPTAVKAQPASTKRAAILYGSRPDDPAGQRMVNAAILGIEDQGWAQGRNLILDVRFNNGDPSLSRPLGQELLALRPDAILAGSTPNALAIKELTSTIPLVFASVQDPVAVGLVSSFARPGGNVTGFTNLEPTVVSKYIDLLLQVVPDLQRVAFLYNPATAQQAGDLFRPHFLSASEARGVEPLEVHVHGVDEIEPVVAGLAQNSSTGIIITADNFFFTNRTAAVAAINAHRLPVVFHAMDAAVQGALMSYSPDSNLLFRSAGNYLGRILSGQNPATLPVQAPTVFLLVINLRTARELGFTIPLSLLATADRIIE